MNRVYVMLGAAALWVAALAYHFVMVASLEGDVTTLKADKTELAAEKLLLTSENKTCAERVGAQNAAIEKAAADGANRAAAASLALADASRRAAAAEALAAAILARPMPKPGDACGSLEILIDEEIERRSK